MHTEQAVTGRRVEIDAHIVKANRDPEEVLREALRVLLRYVRETPQLGHWNEVLPGIPHRPENLGMLLCYLLKSFQLQRIFPGVMSYKS